MSTVYIRDKKIRNECLICWVIPYFFGLSLYTFQNPALRRWNKRQDTNNTRPRVNRTSDDPTRSRQKIRKNI